MPLRWTHSRLLAPLVAGLMLSLTAVYWHNEEQETRDNRRLDFEDAASRVEFHLLQRLSSFALVSRSAKGMFEASKSISRQEFI